MEYRGFEYYQDIQDEDDNRKIFHEIIGPDGEQLDWKIVPKWFGNISPYRSATREEFEQAVNEMIFPIWINRG